MNSVFMEARVPAKLSVSRRSKFQSGTAAAMEMFDSTRMLVYRSSQEA